MINPFENFIKRRELHIQKVNEARSNYTSWLEISTSKGWKIYSDAVDKKIENIVKQITENSTLEGEELKRLQLALMVWKEVQRLPKQLEEKAKFK